MTRAQIVSQTLKLLGGELRDPAGEILTVAARPIVEVRDDAEARAALANGRRAAIAVPLSHAGSVARISALSTARRRITAAKRRLAGAGATRIRALAVMGSADSIFLVYELGGSIQSYIEEYVVLGPPASGVSGLARDVFRQLSGLSPTADLVVIVGESA